MGMFAAIRRGVKKAGEKIKEGIKAAGEWLPGPLQKLVVRQQWTKRRRCTRN